MSGSDGTENGPVDDATRRSGRPPVPAPGPSEQQAGDGQHRTERVPFPLPPLRSEGGQRSGEPRPAAPRTEQLPAQSASAPGQPPAAPVTGQLQLGGYPPRVPGRARPAAQDREPEDETPEDGPGGDDGAR